MLVATADQEKPMTRTKLCAAVLCAAASAVALNAAPAGAVQPSAPLAFKSADTQNLETVRWRHRYHSRWYGARGAYAAAGRYRGYGERHRRGCTGEESTDAAFPSWKCFGADR
jgi:hypothetical protein